MIEPEQLLRGADAWHPQDLHSDMSWQRTLEAGHIAELDTALEIAERKAIDWQSLSREEFPLDAMAEVLADTTQTLESGRGLVTLRGVPVERYSDAQLNTILFGMGLYLGTAVPQDFRGVLLRDITDERVDTDAVLGHRFHARDGAVFQSSKARTASNGPLRFHTDRTDVVGLLCVRAAKSGGVSRIASSVTVHNEIAKRRPDLLALLYEPIYRSRLGEEQGGESMVYPLPVFGVRDGKFTSHYSRTYVEAAQEMPDVPRMSAAQWEALDLLAEVAAEVCFETTMRPGDLQLINNHVIYHARTAYDDGENVALEQRRCLKRIWLSMPNNRPLPLDHSVLWRYVEAGQVRGGIGV